MAHDKLRCFATHPAWHEPKCARCHRCIAALSYRHTWQQTKVHQAAAVGGEMTAATRCKWNCSTFEVVYVGAVLMKAYANIWHDNGCMCIPCSVKFSLLHEQCGQQLALSCTRLSWNRYLDFANFKPLKVAFFAEVLNYRISSGAFLLKHQQSTRDSDKVAF